MTPSLSQTARWIAGLVGFFAAAAVHADDWPQWLGPQRDAIWRESGIVEKFPEGGPKILWRQPIGGGYSGPAVVGGRVYVMDRQLAPGATNPKNNFDMRKVPGSERVLCLSAADGSTIWKHEYDCTYVVSYAMGPRVTPTVHQGKVYTLGTMGNLLCLDAETGKVIWSHDFMKELGVKTPMWGFSSHPLVDGQKLICLAAGTGSTAIAYDKDTGKEIWRALTAKEPGYAPPMIYELAGKRQLIIWDADSVNGLDPETGKVYWSQPQATYSGMSISTPRKEGDNLFITGYPRYALMLHLEGDKPNVQVVWKGDAKKGLFSVFATPYVEADYIYGPTAPDAALACIRASTGERLWSTMAPNGGKKQPSGDCFIVKNGDRYFLMIESGDLVIAQLSPKGYTEISRAHLLDRTGPAFGDRMVVWSHPAFANRCVFARNDKEIVCASLAAD